MKVEFMSKDGRLLAAYSNITEISQEEVEATKELLAYEQKTNVDVNIEN